jgi:hypothetical protein
MTIMKTFRTIITLRHLFIEGCIFFTGRKPQLRQLLGLWVIFLIDKHLILR